MAQSEKEMKTQILEALKSSESRCVTITELQEIVIGDNEGMKKKFLSILDEMALGKKLSVDGENVTKLSKRRRDDVDPNKPIAKGERDEHGNLKQNKAAKYEPKVVPNERVEFNPSELWKNGEQVYRESLMSEEYLRTNPDNITRLFVGNLNRKITQEQLHNAIEGITHIKWITDKLTQEFYGSTFVEVKDPRAAIAAVQMDKQKLMGRPLKIYYCPPRPGDVWPPEAGDRLLNKPVSGQARTAEGGKVQGIPKERREKPEGCTKLFMGNVAYEVDDDTICDFFKDCGEIIGLRWLTHKDTGDFRGCGYIQFATTEAADKAKLLDGEIILKRPIRIDWTD